MAQKITPSFVSRQYLPVIIGLGVILFTTFGVIVFGAKDSRSVGSVSQSTQRVLPTLTPYKKPSPSVAESPSPTPIPVLLKKFIPGPLTTYKDHYGQYKIFYPQNLKIQSCMGDGVSDDCVSFSPVSNSGGMAVDTIFKIYVSMHMGLPEGEVNYQIPALGAQNTAIKSQTNNSFTVDFLHNRVLYDISVDLDALHTVGYSSEGFAKVVDDMIQSISFINEHSTCASRALTPVDTFPGSFTLYNYHMSDGTDPINTYFPYTNKGIKDVSGQSTSKMQTPRDVGFMVNYKISGDSFEDPEFIKRVVAVRGNNNTDFGDVGTGIWHYNCVDTQEDGPGYEQPYHISDDFTDPFALHVYGYSANPQALWGVEKWNIQLLKKYRNEVYVRIGNKWQKYQAIGYFATMPTAYGGKPAIYLYPQTKTDVQVVVRPAGQLVRTDDLYNPKVNGWNVHVSPGGKINNALDYLYYEAAVTIPEVHGGYVVPYAKLFDFSKEYVKELGLNDAEANEFISFWKTSLPAAPYYLVSALEQDTINQLYPLAISPAPDALLRVELYYKPLKAPVHVPLPRKMVPVERKGFTAVEWGAVVDMYR